MRITPMVVVALSVATAATAQERPADTPQQSGPADAAPPPATPDASMPAAPSDAAAAPASPAATGAIGPVYATIAQLQFAVQQQAAYIAQLEKHIMALDDYIATLRSGKH